MKNNRILVASNLILLKFSKLINKNFFIDCEKIIYLIILEIILTDCKELIKNNLSLS